ncbi:MAG: hypothetical protein COA58_04305 [Bacteroidetes bacterium]|nr:MAG: hypothetical protein COA58_04305 [Bacteroidota bacterium]
MINLLLLKTERLMRKNHLQKYMIDHLILFRCFGFKRFLLDKGFLLFLLFFSIFSYGQIEPCSPDNRKIYTVENGLPSDYIGSITEDKFGFLWLCTQKGISRFDGSEFTNFINYIDNNNKEIKIGATDAIWLDSLNDRIWFSGGNEMYSTSISNINIKNIKDQYPEIDFPKKRIQAFTLIKNNFLWISYDSEKGFVCFDLEKNKRKEFHFEYKNQEREYKLNRINVIKQDPVDKNILWLGSKGGLIRFNVSTEEYQIIHSESIISIADISVRMLFISETKVFIGTWAKGVLVYNKRSRDLIKITHKTPWVSLSTTTDFFQEDSVLWITTTKGLIKYNLNKQEASHTYENKIEKGIINGVTFCDSRGIKWFVFAKTLLKFSPEEDVSIMYTRLKERNVFQPPLLSKRIIEHNGYYYLLGYNGYGIYKIDLQAETHEIIKIPPIALTNGSGYPTNDMIKMENGKFLILGGTKIVIFDPVTEKSTLSSLQVNIGLSSIQKGEGGNYWLASRPGGLFKLNFKTGEITGFKKRMNAIQPENHWWMNLVYLDSKDKLWIAKGSRMMYDIKKDRIYGLDPSLIQKYYQDVTGIQEDGKGRIWMAGQSQGLGYMKYDSSGYTISHQFDGYFSGVYSYGDSLLWTIGGNGIGILNTNSLTHENLKIAVSLNSLSLMGPILPVSENKYIIGCKDGYAILSKRIKTENKERVVPYVLSVRAGGAEMYYGDIGEDKNIEFKSGTKHISIEVGALAFFQPHENTFFYKLQDRWIKMEKNRIINILKLPLGKSTLSLKICNAQGVCETVEYVLEIRPFWYETRIAMILFFSLLMAIGYFIIHAFAKRNFLLKEADRLKKMDELKSKFYANITHEFKTPLTLISGPVEDLLSRGNSFSDKERNSFGLIKRNASRLLNLVNQLLDLSKVQSNNVKINITYVEISDFITQLLDTFSFSVTKRKINLRSDIDQNMVGWFDKDILETIISNLIQNAVKYTNKGGDIFVFSEIVEEEFRFSVTNSNENIGKEDLGKVFTRFYQKEDSTEGLGIGLSLVKELIELCNGTIEVALKNADEITFSCKIPITQVNNNNDSIVNEHLTRVLEKPQKKSIPVLLEWKEPLTILLVDDNVDIRNYIKSFFPENCTIIEAQNGKEGVQKALEVIPDVIVSDVMMPIMDGLELCSILKNNKITSHIPIILLTAKTGDTNEIIGLKIGADAYITKPFNRTKLLVRVYKLIELRSKLQLLFSSEPDLFSIDLKISGPDEKFMKNVQNTLNMHLIDPDFNVEIFCKEVGMSRMQLHRKIKSLMGFSVTEFLRSERIKLSTKLLKESEMTINEVAYEVGFNTPSYFIKCFKEKKGMTPSEFRKEKS